MICWLNARGIGPEHVLGAGVLLMFVLWLAWLVCEVLGVAR